VTPYEKVEKDTEEKAPQICAEDEVESDNHDGGPRIKHVCRKGEFHDQADNVKK
jgi:hypothetical protein